MTCMLEFRKPIIALWAPTLLMTLSLAVAGGHLGLSQSIKHILPHTSYGLSLLAVALGLGFKRERVVFAGLLLGLVNLTMLNLWSQASVGGPLWDIAFAALCICLPIYLLSVSFFNESGVLNRSGMIRLMWIVLPAAAVLVAVDDSVPAGAREWLASALHSRPFSTDFDYWSHLPQPAIILFAIAMISLTVRFVLDPTPMEGAMLGAMGAVWAALHHVGNGVLPSMMLSAALLMVIVAVVQDAYHMAFLDELTGLPGRRALFADFRRLGKRYTLAMVDVDHFKNFNDTYGHDVGDQVLQMVANKMARVSGGGRAFRYGGEEFTVLFAGKDDQSVSDHLEALREAIAQASFKLRSDDRPEKAPKNKKAQATGKKSKSVSVTVSIGVAVSSEEVPDPDSVLKAADKALYRAKEGGRNRIAA